jgi:formylglycine-generating enzyme required for sulfatase activity
MNGLATKTRMLALAAPLALCVAGCGGGPGSGGSNGGAGGGTGGFAGAAGGTFQCIGSGAVGETVFVEAGPFTMGCNAEVDTECDDDELPVRTVDLGPFEIDRTEVTQDHYAACVNAGACPPPTCDWDCAAGALPASCVTHGNAQSYCVWAGKRLPTEAEWEKAARGTSGSKFPWGNDAADCGRANMAGCVNARTPVGQFPNGASAHGALDMSGNMVELVADFYDASYYASAPNANPAGPSSGSTYVGRGGGWKSDGYWQRASARDWYDPDDAGMSLGFRCAK